MAGDVNATGAAEWRGRLSALIGRGPVCASVVGLLLGLLLGATPAGAAMHDEKTCKALKLEHAELLRAGIKENMTNGPQWALDHLKPDEIRQIARYLNLDETIMFRCPGSKKPKIKSKIQPVVHKKPAIRKESVDKKVTQASFNPFEGE